MSGYEKAIQADPARVDPYFYIGQHYVLAKDYKIAFPHLKRGAALPVPDRSHFQWMYLYECMV